MFEGNISCEYLRVPGFWRYIHGSTFAPPSSCHGTEATFTAPGFFCGLPHNILSLSSLSQTICVTQMVHGDSRTRSGVRVAASFKIFFRGQSLGICPRGVISGTRPGYWHIRVQLRVGHGSILLNPIQPNPLADWPNPIQSTTTMCIPTHIQSSPLDPAVAKTLSAAIQKMFSLSI